jgi:hypothetical protein
MFLLDFDRLHLSWIGRRNTLFITQCKLCIGKSKCRQAIITRNSICSTAASFPPVCSTVHDVCSLTQGNNNLWPIFFSLPCFFVCYPRPVPQFPLPPNCTLLCPKLFCTFERVLASSKQQDGPLCRERVLASSKQHDGPFCRE